MRRREAPVDGVDRVGDEDRTQAGVNRLLPDEPFDELGGQEARRLRVFALEIVVEKKVEQHEALRLLDHLERRVEDRLFDVANALVVDPGLVGKELDP